MADNNSMIFPTLGDMLQGVNTPVEKKVIESVSFATPLVEKMAQKVIQGTSFYQKVRTSIPVIGAVPYNSGTPVSRGPMVLLPSMQWVLPTECAQRLRRIP